MHLKTPEAQVKKVFCFFFSKKKRFLNLNYAPRPRLVAGACHCASGQPVRQKLARSAVMAISGAGQVRPNFDTLPFTRVKKSQNSASF